jgi:DNA invertase Pin-like site-specific DNA recombinase
MRMPEKSPGLVPAAQYVRMSTEHQQYSTENQSGVIRLYAEAHGMDIVRTYCDAGKSGLSLSGRGGLRVTCSPRNRPD